MRGVCKTEHGWRNAIIIVASHEEEKYPMTPSRAKREKESRAVEEKEKKEREREEK